MAPGITCVFTVAQLVLGQLELAQSSPPPLLNLEGHQLSAAPMVSAAPTVPVSAKHTVFGVALDAGIPDGFGVSAIIRPVHWLKVQLGGTSTTFSGGIRGGVTLAPFFFGITPTLTLEGGHVMPGDANALARRIAGPEFDLDAIKYVSYDYANAHVGLELGSPQHFVFFLRGGLSYFQTQLSSGLEMDEEGLTISAPQLRATLPTLKLGFAIYVF